MKHEDLVGVNRYANHWPIRVDGSQQRLWHKTALRAAGSEVVFDQVWKEWNLAIKSVEVNFILLKVGFVDQQPLSPLNSL